MNGIDLKVLFPGNSYRFLEAGDVMVGGLGFEVGRQKFRDRFVGLTLETATGSELWGRLAGKPGPSQFAVSSTSGWTGGASIPIRSTSSPAAISTSGWGRGPRR